MGMGALGALRAGAMTSLGGGGLTEESGLLTDGGCSTEWPLHVLSSQLAQLWPPTRATRS